MEEVEKDLSIKRKHKASGIDGIPIELYSSDNKYFTPLLTTLFNTIFVSADCPDGWAQGLIYPVHKKGDKSDPQNYRKVSLIPSLAVFESVLENRLSFKNLVCRDDDPLQRGFKKNSRTYDNLFVLYNLVETQKKTRKNSVDDEIHFLITCSYFATQRTSLLAESKLHNTHDSLSNNDKCIYIMSSTHRPLVICLAKYTYTCFQTLSTYRLIINGCYYVTLLSGKVISHLFLYHPYFMI